MQTNAGSSKARANKVQFSFYKIMQTGNEYPSNKWQAICDLPFSSESLSEDEEEEDEINSLSVLGALSFRAGVVVNLRQWCLHFLIVKHWKEYTMLENNLKLA